MPNAAIDVHQHLWPDELVDRLRARTRPPYLRGWTLHTDGEPPYVVDPSAHDPQARVAVDRDAGVGVACVSLSAPLGIEALPRRDAAPLIKAWHRGAVELPQHFRAWASVPVTTPTSRGCAVSSVTRVRRPPAAGHPAAHARGLGASRPGAPRGRGRRRPGARPPGTGDAHRGRPRRAGLVAGGGRLHGPAHGGLVGVACRTRPRSFPPGLRLLFAAAAGLAPVHHERHALRGGTEQPSTGGLRRLVRLRPARIDAVVRVLGIDALVLGSDRPYAEPLTELFGEAATHAVRVTNPARLLGRRPPEQENTPWPSAS